MAADPMADSGGGDRSYIRSCRRMVWNKYHSSDAVAGKPSMDAVSASGSRTSDRGNVPAGSV